MTIHEFAAMLNGRQYRNEITREEESRARELGFVVVYGASDDLCEFAGFIHDEAGAPGTVYIKDNDLAYPPDCDCEYAEKYWEEIQKSSLQLDAIWCPKDDTGQVYASWGYKLHSERDVATFDIMEDDEPYCRGIVFAL